MLYVLSVCSVSYLARNAHAPYHIFSCGLSGSAMFFNQFITGRTLGRKRKLLSIEFGFRFSLPGC